MTAQKVIDMLGDFQSGIAILPDKVRSGNANQKTAEDYNRLRGLALKSQADITQTAPPEATLRPNNDVSDETYGDLVSYAGQLQTLLSDI